MNAITKTEHQTTHEVDARRLNCPYPISCAKIKLQESGVLPGDTVIVLADDPASVDDIEALCRQFGHEFLGSKTEKMDGVIVYAISIKKTG